MSPSKRAQQFQDILDQRRLGLAVQELPESTRTVNDAARTLGCSKAQIVKSLVFRDAAEDKPVVVLASGPNRVNEKRIDGYLGHEIGKADADFVKSRAGYAIGGVLPLGHLEPVKLFADEDLLQFEEVWPAAGTPSAVFKIPGKITDILPELEMVSVK